jgi:hypothetical protein
VIDPHTQQRIEIDIDAGGRALITAPVELMAAIRTVLSKGKFMYSGGNSLFHGAGPGLYTAITLPPGVDLEEVQKALDAAD